jgi:hypothetical protein
MYRNNFVLYEYMHCVLSTLEILFINIDKFPAGPQRRVAAKNLLAGNEVVSVVVFNLKNPTTKEGETVACTICRKQ